MWKLETYRLRADLWPWVSNCLGLLKLPYFHRHESSESNKYDYVGCNDKYPYKA